MGIKYKRVLIKLSGEALAGEDKFGVNPDVTLKTAKQIKEIRANGVDVAIVVGGGNFFRGRTGGSIDIRCALIGPGVDASHSYERLSLTGFTSLNRLRSKSYDGY